MKKLEASQARQEFAETLNQVAYGKSRILVRRRGKALAVIVPVDDLELIQRCEEDEAAKPPKKAGGAPKPAARRSRRKAA